MTKVYGYSDDNVVIEDATRDEIEAYDSKVDIRFSDNTLIEICYGDDGIWHIKEAHEVGSRRFDRCWCCGGKGKNCYTPSGTLIRKSYPYVGTYKGRGKWWLSVLCRACAYNYGKGVIEMDGVTYYDYYDFKETAYKVAHNYKYEDEE